MEENLTGKLIRYSKITEKEKREVLLLRGHKCAWHRCRFCDYHLDSSSDDNENFLINKSELDKVTGEFGILEISNSGSFNELDSETIKYIKDVCLRKEIQKLIFESHWIYRNKLGYFRKIFNEIGVKVEIKIGVETFDSIFRESYLEKGIDESSPEKIAKFFDRVCLLFGLPGQTTESMLIDIQTALKYFNRVYVSIMNKNSSKIFPDERVIEDFRKKIYPLFSEDERLDILFNNTDFGIGGFVFE